MKKRLGQLDAMQELSDCAASAERLFSPAEQKSFALGEETVRDIDDELDRLRAAEQRLAASARPAELPHQHLAMPGRGDAKPFKGQAFTRYVGALALAKGNLPQAVEIAQRWSADTPEVENVLRAASRLGSTSHDFWVQRAAVAVGTTVDVTWAKPLADYTSMASEFIDLLRPVTILGRLPGLTPVPFNVQIPRQTAGASAGWVGEGLSKPVSALALDLVKVPFAKTATIVVISQELARFSTPSAELLVRNDLIATIAQFLDTQFVDASITPIAGVRPGAITNGAPSSASTGGTVGAVTADLNKALLNLMTALQGNITSPAWLMSPSAALYLATLRTAQDVFAFPGMSLGGTPGSLGPTPSLLGIPVVVSGNITLTGGKSNIILVEQSQIMLADDGATTIDTSSEASVQMDSAPATPPVTLVSLWQQNLLGIKAERYVYWLLRRSGSVQIVTGFPGP